MDWRKSSHSANNGACLEAAPAWRKSSHCASRECLEVASSWRKSSHSNATNCLQVAGAWVTSSLSFSNGNCVQAAPCGCAEPGILVRDSKDPEGPVLSFGAGPWAAFLARVSA